jgi:putative DNA primase/helicase
MKAKINGTPTTLADGPGLWLHPSSPLTSAEHYIKDKHTYQSRQILYRHLGAFFHWETTRYLETSKDELTADLYKYLKLAKYKNEKNEDKPFNPNRTKVGDVLGALGAAAHMHDTVIPPAWLCDEPPTDIEARDILACENGLLHLPSLSLIPHTPDFFSVNAIDYPYEPNTIDPPQWLEFLRQLWPNDQESIDTLQEMFGYMLVADTTQQKAFMLVGPKRSGKGTIARILEAVIGPQNAVSPTLASLGSQFGAAPLIGKRLAIISDARISARTDTAVVAERLLGITGEDSQTIDRKFVEAWTGKLDVRFVLISNELPRIADASGALPSRFIVLMLTNSFFGKEDRGLTMRLMTERPHILNWAIAGYRRLIERGYFLQPASANEAIRDLEDLGSPISAFLRDCCFVEAGREVQCTVLFREWGMWCDAQGRSSKGTMQSFGRDLRAVVPALKITQPRVEGTQIRHYDGIGLANTLSARPDDAEIDQRFSRF